jgi:DNA-binding response OmpR family regulator
VTELLLIDDDKSLTELFEDYLSQEGFAVDVAHDGMSGLDAALSGRHDLVLLDMMLPDTSGTEVLKKIRAESDIPVLMFTAKGDDIDRIIGLELGADDYVPKPCTPRELVARVRAILRRARTSQPDLAQATLKCGELEISKQTRKAFWGTAELFLTSSEFNLLFTLASKAGQVVTKNELSEKALGKAYAPYDRSIDVHISSIRQKLGQGRQARQFIQTIRGHGYQIIKS